MAGRDKSWQLALMLAPLLLLYGIFNLAPIIGLFGVSLTEWHGVGALSFVGWDNFRELFTNDFLLSSFIRAIYQNAIFFICAISFLLGLGLIFAWFITLSQRIGPFFRVLFFLPYPLAGAAVAFMLAAIFDSRGAMNYLLLNTDLIDSPIPFLGSEDISLILLSLFYVWHRMGLAVLLILAAFTNINREAIEAATIDSASITAILRRIVLPVALPSLMVLTVIILVDVFNNADYTLLVQGAMAGPNYSTDVLGSFLYRAAFGAGASDLPLGLGMAACIGLLTSVIVAPIATLALKAPSD